MGNSCSGPMDQAIAPRLAKLSCSLPLASGGAAAIPMTIVTRVGMQFCGFPEPFPSPRSLPVHQMGLFAPTSQIQEGEQDDTQQRVERSPDDFMHPVPRERLPQQVPLQQEEDSRLPQCEGKG
jgi:hypothetical protein